MLAVGLTGGIGAGKSTVASVLVELGAALVDADRIARSVVDPGQPAHRALVERFGRSILTPDGRIDRPRLAAIAFGDRSALSDLNAITHPAIATEMARQRAAYEDTDRVVLLDIPLMTPAQRGPLALDVVVVVDCDPGVAMQRVVSDRGMDPAQVRARMAAQPSRRDRLEGADFVVDNSGSLADLRREVGQLWSALERLAKEDSARPS
ncbi:MAG TPA: dephospho-CoA kinase [Acidimicrobiales bacterium]|nr:dephospho-CoA kinase [Acidimicrobiales bacterium]